MKKAPIIPTKGKSKISKKSDSKRTQEKEAPIERLCPLEGCDSMGHLSGKYEKHFTIEACPKYHNLSNSDTKMNLEERLKREEERNKAVQQMSDPLTRKILTNEQRAYQQKIRDVRAKFKPNPPPQEKGHKERQPGDEREPCLAGIVSDYDLQLFRDAQALASENIENELKQLPASKGTKFVTMGKYQMEVWYQSGEFLFHPINLHY